MSADIFMCFVVVVLCKKFRIKMWWEKKEVTGEHKGPVSDQLKFIPNWEFKKITYSF